MSGGGGSSTTVEKADPWEGVQPFLRSGYSDASQLYTGTAPQYYPGQTVQGFNPIQEAGFGSAINFAAEGAPDIYNMARSSLGGLLGGGTGTQSVYGTGSGSAGAPYVPTKLDPLAKETAASLMGAIDPSKDPGFAAAQQLAAQGDPTKLLGYEQMQGLQAASDPTQNQAYASLQAMQGFDPTQLGGYGAISQLMQAGDPSTNPYFQSTLQGALRPVTQQFQEEIMPALQRNANLMGNVGSSRQGIAEGLAASRANQQMADIAAQMGNTAYGQGLQAMATAGGLGAEYGQLGLSAQQAAGQLGSQITGQQLQGLGAAGQLGSTLQGQALGNLQAGGQMQSAMYGQGLQAAQAGTGLEYGLKISQDQVAADMAKASAQLQASRAASAGASSNARLQAQIQALGMLPMLSNLGLQQSNVLGQIGGQYQGMGQTMLDADQARWNYEQQQPYNMFQDYMGMLAGAPGGQRSTSQPMTSNPIRSGLGGAMTGYAAGSALGGAGGAAGGAAAGSSLGLYGAAAGGLLGLMGII